MEILKSIGHHGLWGYSPTFDMQEAFLNTRSKLSVAESSTSSSSSSSGEEDDDNRPLNILLVNPGDIRHIISTISRRRRHILNRNDKNKATTGESQLRPINFYLLESPAEVLARDILLLEVLHDYEVPIRQRATVFLEIFGNFQVQERTARYIEQLGHQLRSLVCDSSGRLEDIIDLSCLKYRDRDALETAFKSYSRSFPYDAVSLRDHRLRGLYAERYDSRAALVDWDYHSTIKPSASIVHIKQFKEWRMSGIGFEFNDQTYDQPNRSMMTYTEGFMKKGKERGIKKEVKGFWGDIVSGPFFSFGLDCETRNKHAEGLFEIMNKDTGTEQHRHHTVEVALFNLLAMLWEIETGTPYKMTKAHDVYSGLGKEANFQQEDNDTKEREEGEKEGGKEEDEGEKGEGEKELLPPAPTASSTNSNPPLPPPPPQSNKSAEQEEEEELAKTILRAECIVDSLAGVKVIPLLGAPSEVLDKTRYHNLFDVIFVSSRSGQCISAPYFRNLLHAKGLVCVETGKFLAPLNQAQKQALADKLREGAKEAGWTEWGKEVGGGVAQAQAQKLTQGQGQGKYPVFRRRRDDKDTLEDVLFFHSNNTPSTQTH